jgi:hypothetical protein
LQNNSNPLTTDEIVFNYDKNYNYIGLDFSLNTINLKSYKGTYNIVLSLLNEKDEPLANCEILSSELYGNPYTLTENIRF